MTTDILDLLRRKPWRRPDHRVVFASFAGALGALIAPPAHPPRIHSLP